VKEEFLQYIWQTSLFRNESLKTTAGHSLQIIKPGTLNQDSGPDFFNSKLLLDQTLWAGNVEVHLHSSEWMQHGHQFDAAYNNVVLHVVYEHDEEIVNQLGKSIPTLELRSYIPAAIIAKYNQLYLGSKWIACESMLPGIDHDKIHPFIHRLLIERLEDKVRYIMQDLQLNKKNWEQTFYEYLARNFGFKTNALPFHILAKSLPIQILAKYKPSLLQIEALLFGQAGFLNEDFTETYPNQLKNEYAYLKKAHQLEPIHPDLWKFSAMRPANFPTVRIAQFAHLVHASTSLFSKCMEVKNMQELEVLFEIQLHDYWNNHYRLDQPATIKEKKLGRASIENILMNTVAIFMFAYGKDKLNESLCKHSIEMMENLPAEVNGIIKKWTSLGFRIQNAFDSQAFIQLKNMYCTPKKCLSCSIGNQILRP
jgi:hypothetical protein